VCEVEDPGAEIGECLDQVVLVPAVTERGAGIAQPVRTQLERLALAVGIAA